jgi:hypothetical protein
MNLFVTCAAMVALTATILVGQGPSPGQAANQDVTYARDIASLLNDRCAMCHHPAGAAPFSLLTMPNGTRGKSRR